MYGRVMCCGTVTFYRFEVGEALKIFSLCNCPCCKAGRGCVRQSVMAVGTLLNVRAHLCVCVSVHTVCKHLIWMCSSACVFERQTMLSSLWIMQTSARVWGGGRSGGYTAFELQQSKHWAENTTSWNRKGGRGLEWSGHRKEKWREEDKKWAVKGRMRGGGFRE